MEKEILNTHEAIALCEKHGISKEEFYEAAINGDLNPFIIDQDNNPVGNARVIGIDQENNELIIQELDD